MLFHFKVNGLSPTILQIVLQGKIDNLAELVKIVSSISSAALYSDIDKPVIEFNSFSRHFCFRLVSF